MLNHSKIQTPWDIFLAKMEVLKKRQKKILKQYHTKLETDKIERLRNELSG